MEHLTDLELAGYLDDELPPEERAAVEEHLDACPRCRREAVEVARLLDSSSSDARPTVAGRRKWRVPAGIAGLVAAAALAALILVPPHLPVDQVQPPQRERVSFEGVERLRTHGPPDEAPIPRDSLRFVWADRATESYRLSVMSEAGSLLWSTTVTDTVAELPRSVDLPSGERFFWFVDAIDGGVVARTRPHSFIVAP